MTNNQFDELFAYTLVVTNAITWFVTYIKFEKKLKFWTFQDVVFLIFFTVLFPLGFFDTTIMWLEHWRKT